MLRIDKIMKERNITTLQLAEMMKVTPQYISEVVNERKNITISVLANFAKALQVPMASLVDGYYEKDQLGFNSFNCPYCGNVISIEKSDKR
ncbi:MAG: helix-turn-helix transcriptional regulator [Prevotella sp.]|nr:helix-turn-helix transcriptional regulator [Prevotella sp.]